MLQQLRRLTFAASINAVRERIKVDAPSPEDIEWNSKA